MKTQQDSEKNIDSLVRRRLLWRGGEALQAGALQGKLPVISTGEKQLDRQLHCGGWPLSQLIECLPKNNMLIGAGVFLPGLKNLQALFGHHWPVILLDPPAMPYLESWPLHPETPVWILKPKNLQEKIWLAENTLQSNCSLCTLIWLPENNLPATQIRKLQLAATKNRGLSIVFRNQQSRTQASAASLRFETMLCASGKKNIKANLVNIKTGSADIKTSLAIDILKQPNGWGGQRCLLPWHSRLQRPRLHASEWPVYIPEEHSIANWSDQAPSHTRTRTQQYS